VNSTYKVASPGISEPFVTGQTADMMLSGFGFNDAGGPLVFNHQGGIASDGDYLALTDRNNNRVLVWNHLPDENEPPDIVLGQSDFQSNAPGDGRDGMNWPVSVVMSGGRIVVADTENHRILIWNQVPDESGTPADIVLTGRRGDRSLGEASKTSFNWPWGVWTDGERVAITSTRGG
jgi:hypothetical protein